MVVVTGRIAHLRVNRKTTIPKNTKPPDKASNIKGLLKPAKGLAPYMIAPLIINVWLILGCSLSTK
jgi:hypothetical protein